MKLNTFILLGFVGLVTSCNLHPRWTHTFNIVNKCKDPIIFTFYSDIDGFKLMDTVNSDSTIVIYERWVSKKDIFCFSDSTWENVKINFKKLDGTIGKTDLTNCYHWKKTETKYSLQYDFLIYENDFK